MTAPSPSLRDQLAGIVRAHQEYGRVVEGVWCRCGWRGVSHPAHVAEQQLPVVQAAIADELDAVMDATEDGRVYLYEIRPQIRARASALRAPTTPPTGNETTT